MLKVVKICLGVLFYASAPQLYILNFVASYNVLSDRARKIGTSAKLYSIKIRIKLNSFSDLFLCPAYGIGRFTAKVYKPGREAETRNRRTDHKSRVGDF